MKTLSVLAIIFLPITTVATVFGTQFFTSVDTSPSSPSSPSNDGEVDGKTKFVVNSKFWMLWAISLPITSALIVGWWFWIKHTRRVLRRDEQRESDVERIEMRVYQEA